MKAIILVVSDETQTATISQGDHNVTVGPGQNAEVEITSTHPLTISVEDGHPDEPEVPAQPVVTDSPTLSQGDAGEAVVEDPAPSTPETPPSTVGDTGASVVPGNAPAEVQAVADALQQTNTAVAEAGAAASDFSDATAAIPAATDAVTEAQATVDTLPEDVNAQDKAAADQALADAQAARDQLEADAKAAADAHAAAIQAAQDAADAATQAAAAVQDAVADPNHPATEDHGEIAQQMADNATQAVANAPQLPSADEVQAAPAEPAPEQDPSSISPAGDTGTTQDGAGNVTTGPTVTDQQIADGAASQGEETVEGGAADTPPAETTTAAPADGQAADQPADTTGVKIETDEDLRNIIAGLLDGDVTTDDVLTLSTLNAALEAKGYAPITEEQHEVAKDAISDL